MTGRATEVDVGAIGDFPPGVPVVVRAGSREIVVVHWDDSFYALRNICPHQTQSFDKGLVHFEPMEGDRPGELVIDKGRPVIACPWHKWTYDLHDGHCTRDPNLRVRAYDVIIRDGRVLIDDTPQRPARAGGPGPVEAAPSR